MSDMPDLEALKKAAEAAAEQAAAAQAALEAAMTAATSDDSAIGQIASGYRFEGETLPLGVALDDGEPVPAAKVGLPLAMMNRHGLVAGATGTGKTRTLQLMAEGLSDAGVPSFVMDIKGDLTGLLEPGASSEKLLERTSGLGQEWQAKSFPVELYKLGEGGVGIPIRTSLSDFGPLLLARVLDLNETQESALQLIFHWADMQHLALIDVKDLRSVVGYLTGEGKDELKEIGGISAATAGVILRKVAALEAQGGDVFFGEPAFDTSDLLETRGGAGVISVLELPNVHDQPALFSTFVMWLLASLFQTLPEVGDQEKPKLVFFFDEAHLLFNGASKAFLAEVVKTVRLVRSKGVGIYFVTQTPKDVPEDVLAQLGGRVQHALRAFTPTDAKKLKETVSTFPTSPFDLGQILTSLGTGEAVVTVLDRKGRPTPVAPTRLYTPAANMGEADATVVQQHVDSSPNLAKYKDAVDPESAFELLEQRLEAEARAREEEQRRMEEQKALDAKAKELEKELARQAKEREKELERQAKEREREYEKARREAERAERAAQARRERFADDLMRTAGRTLTREITRTLFGTRRR
ncbi:helicase HerA-like domain-containing protein [Actinomyces sp. HMSC075B09]|uniref:helicase HerA-like domain-containing protein n=1 Tax=Actinomyces sp. HMSC075B09 TaxID=1739358 RepID=UPI0008A1C336|nr:helicase HerA-like domain-containing protein [Actinomyces sp. HMSC075B09]OFJ62604.1 ATPase [Actinomyces sp. HMSC075B09]